MKNPIKMGDLGGFPPIFGSTSMKVSVEDSSSHIPGIPGASSSRSPPPVVELSGALLVTQPPPVEERLSNYGPCHGSSMGPGLIHKHILQRKGC